MFEQQEDNEKDDFFESTEEAPAKPKKEKKPHYRPDDPRYWEAPEDEFEHLRPSRRVNWRLWFWLVGSLVVIVGLWLLSLYMFKPYETEAHISGYLEHVVKDGDIFTTYEGTLLPYANLMDTLRSYEGDFNFSTKDPSLAARLKDMELSNLPVRLKYKRYHTALPWRGATEIIVTEADTVSAELLLPPDRQPEFIKVKEEEVPLK